MIPVENAITTPNNTHILDSNMVRNKDEMREFLETVRRLSSSEMAVCQRDIESMLCE